MGVQHSAQLVAESYQPAVFRAFIDKVKPDAVCIERSPQEFARNDFYEFTYEQQYLVVPYARKNKIPLYPIDWLPQAEDTTLAFNIADLEKPLFIRRPEGFLGFTSFKDKDTLETDLFYAETEDNIASQKEFANQPAANARFDFARRLYLYRTFMQAMRILRAAKEHQGETVLVIIGSLHKNNIEEILKGEQSLEIIQPSTFGKPAAENIKRNITTADLFAIAAFNFLGIQAKTGNVDWEWMKNVLEELEKRAGKTPETILLKTRLQVLTKKISSQEALNKYKQAFESVDDKKQFSWNGVKDFSRVDSYFDPFGNLTIKQRLNLEMARENYKLKQTSSAENIFRQLREQLPIQKSKQLEAYWEDYVVNEAV